MRSQQTAFGRARVFKLRLQFFPEHLYPKEAGITFADVAHVFKTVFMLKLQVRNLPLSIGCFACYLAVFFVKVIGACFSAVAGVADVFKTVFMFKLQTAGLQLSTPAGMLALKMHVVVKSPCFI